MKLSWHLESEQSVLMEEGEELKALLAGDKWKIINLRKKVTSEKINWRQLRYTQFKTQSRMKKRTKSSQMTDNQSKKQSRKN